MYKIDNNTKIDMVIACDYATNYHINKMKWAVENDFSDLVHLYAKKIGQFESLKSKLKELKREDD